MEIFLDTLKWSVIVGVLALALALLRPALEKRYEARWRYWAWLVLAALALLAPVQWEKLLPVPSTSAPVVIDVPEMEVQVIQGERPSLALRPAYAAPPAGIVPEVRRTWQLAEVLPKLWLGGAGVFALYMLAGTWLFRHKARRWSREPKEETARMYASVREDMGLKKAPPLRISSAVGSPMLVGLLRPCLYLPGEDWSGQALSFILRHELTHFKRHDLWYKLALLSANALHWFNPLVYLLVWEAGADLELTCDDEVVFGADQETRRAYSETLLGAVHRHKGLGASLSTHFYGGKKVMMERFRNILGRQRRRWGLLALVLTLVIAAASACAFGIRHEPAEQGERDEVQAHIDGQIDRLAENGVAVIDQRSEFTLVDTFNWGFAGDRELQVWKLEYALKLEHPEDYPLGESYFEELDADGWLSGIDSLGTPHFIYSVFRGEKEPRMQLEETAYSNVEWEMYYTWEEYVCCHTVYGMELSPILTQGWPDNSVRFILSLLDGHESWALDWEDVALSYLVSLGEDTETSLDPQYSFVGNKPHDEAKLVFFSTSSGKTGQMLLAHVNMTSIAEGVSTPLSFWQVVGIGWDAAPPEGNPQQYTDFFSSWSDDYQALFDESLKTDGAYAEMAAAALTKAFNRDAETFLSELSKRDMLEMYKIASQLAYGESYYEDAFREKLSALEGADLSAGQRSALDAVRMYVGEHLTESDLAYFADYFNSDGFHNGLLRFQYTGNADELASYLGILFYDAGEPVTDQEELNAVAELAGGPLEVDCTRLTTDFILNSLNSTFVGALYSRNWLEQAAADQFGLYLPEYDAYYMLHGDTNWANCTFTDGILTAEGEVTLFYTADIFRWEDGELQVDFDQPMQLSLASNGPPNWWVRANTAQPWEEPELFPGT